jgi:hypothetical protein
MAGSQATAGLRGGVTRDSRRHTYSERTRLGPASARRPGPQQGEGGFLTSRSGHDGEEGVVKSSGTAWSRSRAARSMASWPRRRFLERGDLRLQAAAVSSVRRRSSAGRAATWGSGGAVASGSSMGGGRRRRAAPESSTAGLPERLQHGVFPHPAASPAGRRRCGSLAARRPRLLHGRPSALLLPAPSFFPSPPLFLRWTGRKSSMGGGAVQGGGWATTCRGGA